MAAATRIRIAYLKRAFELHRIERRPTPMIFFKVRADGSEVWQPCLGLRQHVELLQRTLASEALVQQVLAAWRTATAGRPKGEDLYSPRKDLGADLHSDFPTLARSCASRASAVRIKV